MSAVLEGEIVHPRRIRRQYSAEQRADALALFDANGSVTETANATGIPDSTLSQWITGTVSPDLEVSALRIKNAVDTSALTTRFDQIVFYATNLVLDRLRDPRRANKIPLPHLMNAIGISVDKGQLLRGLPTNISASVMSEEERQLKLAEVLTRLEAKAIEGQISVEQTMIEGSKDAE